MTFMLNNIFSILFVLWLLPLSTYFYPLYLYSLFFATQQSTQINIFKTRQIINNQQRGNSITHFYYFDVIKSFMKKGTGQIKKWQVLTYFHQIFELIDQILFKKHIDSYLFKNI